MAKSTPLIKNSNHNPSNHNNTNKINKSVTFQLNPSLESRSKKSINTNNTDFHSKYQKEIQSENDFNQNRTNKTLTDRTIENIITQIQSGSLNIQ